MGMKKNGPGGCSCCSSGGTVCSQCTNITYVTISGLSNASCPSGCDNKNGTYVFRAVGDPIPTGCFWTYTWANDNCGANDTPALMVGGIYSGCSDRDMSIELTNVTGGVRVTVTITLMYNIGDFDTLPTSATKYICRWQKTFSNCTAISGSLPFLSTTKTFCSSDTGADTGDLCGLASASVSIG